MNDVVKLSEINGVATICLEDRDSKNAFSENIIKGLDRAVNKINASDRAKCVVIHGYDSYFCCGGTKEELVAIATGLVNFKDFGFFDILMQIEVPTISAMQGHAIGGGLAFGLYADIVIAAEESLYCANFMNYGFTPGMGATAIVPERLGATLASEMLITGNSYYGSDLKQRGAGIRVVKRKDVVNIAMELAKTISEKPRKSLVLLKNSLNSELKARLALSVENEINMHKDTFLCSDVLRSIETNYR